MYTLTILWVTRTKHVDKLAETYWWIYSWVTG